MFLLFFTAFIPRAVLANGIVLAGTRMIYPADSKQVTQSIRNTSATSSFLVQSWMENSAGNKTSDFIMTPPLYVSNPGDENILRVMYSGPALAKDRETLYYFNAKSVPSVDKKAIEGRNVLMLAAVTRIKVFVRPDGLTPSSTEAPASLKFNRNGNIMRINNPTPYHITLINMKAGKTNLKDIMVAPMSEETVALPGGSGSTINFSTINDHGAVTPQKTVVIN